MEFGNINALKNLLKESESAAAAYESELLPNRSLEPTKIVLPSGRNPDPTKSQSKDKDIWHEAEIPSEDALVDPDDKRPVAKFEISYKHDNIGTGDTFLGMSGKSISSSEATHLVVKIYFPRSRMEDIDLDCTRNRVKASSKLLRMFTYLPVPVDHLKGSAKFDPKTFVLTVVLPIIDEGLI